jgi:hypothetical protein
MRRIKLAGMARYAVLCSALVLSACKESTDPGPSIVSGTYALQSIDGAALPALYLEFNDRVVRILGDTLHFSTTNIGYRQGVYVGVRVGPEPEEVTLTEPSAPQSFAYAGSKMILHHFFDSIGSAVGSRVNRVDFEVVTPEGRRWRYKRL